MTVNYYKIGKTFFGGAKSQMGRLIYSTGRSEKTVTTLFDVFKENTLYKIKPEKLAQDIYQRSSAMYKNADELFKPLAEKYGKFDSRIKRLNKLESKIPRSIQKMDSEKAIEVIQSGSLMNIIGDSYGARITFNKVEDVEKFLDELLKAGKDLKIVNIENYHGKGITPYISQQFSEKLTGKYGIEVINSIKNAGYTRANVNILYKGVPIELQLGGEYTTKFGDVEHFLYDMRGGCNPDLSNLNPEKIKLFNNMRQDYQYIMKKPILHDIHNNYLNDVWKTLKVAEEAKLPFPKLPELPSGLPKSLTVENLFLLGH